MKEIIEQFENLKIARFEIRLKSSSDTVLNALIGSALRGAFGHSLKAIACSMPHGKCGECLLSEACLYTTIFEPTSDRLSDAPRPFIFEPPVPPLTKEISESKDLKLNVEKNGLISFGLTIVGDAIEKLPYFIYAIELFSRHGIGAERSTFEVADVWAKDLDSNRYKIYSPKVNFIEPYNEFIYSAKELTINKLKYVNITNSLKLKLLTPLRIRRSRELLTEPLFIDIFKQSSLRLKFVSETYGKQLDYDYKNLLEKSHEIKTIQNIWRHDFKRWTNRGKEKLDLDGMLGEFTFEGELLNEFLPFLAIGEILHIGSSSSFGLGKYKMLNSSI